MRKKLFRIFYNNFLSVFIGFIFLVNAIIFNNYIFADSADFVENNERVNSYNEELNGSKLRAIDLERTNILLKELGIQDLSSQKVKYIIENKYRTLSTVLELVENCGKINDITKMLRSGNTNIIVDKNKLEEETEKIKQLQQELENYGAHDFADKLVEISKYYLKISANQEVTNSVREKIVEEVKKNEGSSMPMTNMWNDKNNNVFALEKTENLAKNVAQLTEELQTNVANSKDIDATLDNFSEEMINFKEYANKYSEAKKATQQAVHNIKEEQKANAQTGELQATQPEANAQAGELQATQPEANAQTGELQATQPEANAQTGELQATQPEANAQTGELQATQPEANAQAGELQTTQKNIPISDKAFEATVVLVSQAFEENKLDLNDITNNPKIVPIAEEALKSVNEISKNDLNDTDSIIELAEIKKKIKEQTETIAALSKTVEEQQRELESQKQEIAVKDAKIEEQSKALDEKDKELQDKDKELQDKDKELQESNEKLALALVQLRVGSDEEAPDHLSEQDLQLDKQTTDLQEEVSEVAATEEENNPTAEVAIDVPAPPPLPEGLMTYYSNQPNQTVDGSASPKKSFSLAEQIKAKRDELNKAKEENKSTADAPGSSQFSDDRAESTDEKNSVSKTQSVDLASLGQIAGVQLKKTGIDLNASTVHIEANGGNKSTGNNADNSLENVIANVMGNRRKSIVGDYDDNDDDDNDDGNSDDGDNTDSLNANATNVSKSDLKTNSDTKDDKGYSNTNATSAEIKNKVFDLQAQILAGVQLIKTGVDLNAHTVHMAGNAQKDNTQKDNTQKDNTQKDNTQKDNTQKDNAQKDNAQKDNAQKDNTQEKRNLWDAMGDAIQQKVKDAPQNNSNSDIGKNSSDDNDGDWDTDPGIDGSDDYIGFDKEIRGDSEVVTSNFDTTDPNIAAWLNYNLELSNKEFMDTYFSGSRTGDKQTVEKMLLNIQRVKNANSNEEKLKLTDEMTETKLENSKKYFAYKSICTWFDQYLPTSNSQNYLQISNDIEDFKELCIIVYMFSEKAINEDFSIYDAYYVAKTVKGLGKKLFEDGRIPTADFFDDIIYKDGQVNIDKINNISKEVMAMVAATVVVDNNDGNQTAKTNLCSILDGLIKIPYSENWKNEIKPYKYVLCES